VSAPVSAPDQGRLPAGIAILGPTGSGKSSLAMRVAGEIPAEIISVDSAQVYRGLDIGTAKPSLEERRRVPHHLLDIREPDEVYSAGEFRADCLALVKDIAARGRVPLLVGGTMLYYRALFQGIAALPAADASVREAIDARAAREGWPALHAELATHDPDSAARIHPHDAQRIQRALEVLALSGRPLGEHWVEHWGEHRSDRPGDSLSEATGATAFADWHVAVLEPADRAALHTALARRLTQMLAAGFVVEAEQLHARRDLDANAPVLRLVGYRQMAGYCRGEEPLAAATDHILAATRQLAKRQLTWLRSGNLLPYGATILRADPFDAVEMERLSCSLIKARPSP
jgi:tRNA dimethylallyltransferase